ncbi:unnamed protein product [Mytilus coruscus]|uniref:Uncharacterized protein n=1 Tax=Mytilus coruscus TaxID=42192 RepID=A0A6J8DFD9_MYTCO|nr:unnamed protein product [Mytilus coruscus]
MERLNIYIDLPKLLFKNYFKVHVITSKWKHATKDSTYSVKATHSNSSNSTSALASPGSSPGSDKYSPRTRNVSPVKSRRVSLPKIGLNTPRNIHKRRLSSVSDSEALPNSLSQSRSRLLQETSSRSFTSSFSENKEFDKQKNKTEDCEDNHIEISPFPYESFDYDNLKYGNNDKPTISQKDRLHRKRINYKQFKDEKELERQRILMKKKLLPESDPFDHRKEILRQQAENKRAALLLEKARQEAVKNKKDVCNSFCYSFAMEELMKKSDPLAYIASEKDFISKVEVDKNGTIKQTLGPAVLTIIGVDELENFQGMRIKWSAKYRSHNIEENEHSGDIFLPPITVGGQKNNFSRETTREHDNLHIHRLDSQSTISKKKQNRRRKRKATMSSKG